MSYENYYEYNSDVDLDAQTLFDYVSQQSEVRNVINNVVPAKPDIFGQAMEPFENGCNARKIKLLSNDESNTNNMDNRNNTNNLKELQLNTAVVAQEQTSYFKWIIFILLALLALYFLFRTRMTCNLKGEQNIVLNENTIDTLTPAVRSEFRAIFAR